MLKVIRSQLHTLFIPLIFWLIGIIIATKFSYHWTLNILVTISFLIMLFYPKLRIYFILFISLMLGWMHTSTYLKTTSNEIGYYLTPDKSINEVFTYKVLESKLTSKDKRYYIIELRQLNDYSMKGKLLLYNAPDSLKNYHIYRSPITIENIEKAHNPAEFDFQRYYAYQGIQGRASTNGLTSFIGKEETFWTRLKSAVTSKIEATFRQNKSLALALFLGEKDLLKIDQERLANLGLLHLFAVSGLHVGVIYLTVLIILNLILNLNWARLGTSIILIFYGYLCAWSPSVFRTVLIIFIYNFTLVFQRKISFLQLLSITLFIITITNPLQVFSVGLHLSLTAFISLWLADRKFLPLLDKYRRKYKLNKYILGVIQYLIYSLSVVIFIAPLSAYYFNVVSFNSLITNIVVTPIVSLMLNVILLSLLLPQGFVAQEYLAKAFSLLKALFEKIIEYSASLPLFTRRFALTGFELLAIILVTIVFLFLYKKDKVKALILIASAVILLFLTLSGLFVNYQNQVICLDAGKADCSYLEFADGKNLLIDTGSQEQPPNIIKNSLLPYLRKRHIHNLDMVIITHAHEDHYGGLALLAKNIDIKELIIHQTALGDETFAQIIQELESDIIITILQDTTSIWDRRIRFLHPDVNYESINMNNNSLVTQVTYNHNKLLFTGDIEEEAEQRLVRQYGDGIKSNFLKIPHHGSITSSSVEFLDSVNPDKCFIPAGNRDRDKFPNPIVLKRLQDMNIEIFIGGDDGAMKMIIDR